MEREAGWSQKRFGDRDEETSLHLLRLRPSILNPPHKGRYTRAEGVYRGCTRADGCTQTDRKVLQLRERMCRRDRLHLLRLHPSILNPPHKRS
jgi:hypothetical protein